MKRDCIFNRYYGKFRHRWYNADNLASSLSPKVFFIGANNITSIEFKRLMYRPSGIVHYKCIIRDKNQPNYVLQRPTLDKLYAHYLFAFFITLQLNELNWKSCNLIVEIFFLPTMFATNEQEKLFIYHKWTRSIKMTSTRCTYVCKYSFLKNQRHRTMWYIITSLL